MDLPLKTSEFLLDAPEEPPRARRPFPWRDAGSGDGRGGFGGSHRGARGLAATPVAGPLPLHPTRGADSPPRDGAASTARGEGSTHPRRPAAAGEAGGLSTGEEGSREGVLLSPRPDPGRHCPRHRCFWHTDLLAGTTKQLGQRTQGRGATGWEPPLFPCLLALPYPRVPTSPGQVPHRPAAPPCPNVLGEPHVHTPYPSKSPRQTNILLESRSYSRLRSCRDSSSVSQLTNST